MARERQGKDFKVNRGCTVLFVVLIALLVVLFIRNIRLLLRGLLLVGRAITIVRPWSLPLYPGLYYLCY